MKKWFRNLVLTLAVFFTFNISNAQNSITIGNGEYNNWQLTNKPCYGCGSLYIMVVNNPTPKKGYYYYDIYFWSNSFYANGYAANTYVKQIGVYTIDPAGNELSIFKTPYAVVAPKSDIFNGYFYVGYVYSTSAMQEIKIEWFKATAW